MGHNINSMAYYGERPWHRLGVEVAEAASAFEMIKAAGLDWTVAKEPAPGAGKRGKDRFSRYQIVRKARPGRKEDDIVLGLATDSYEPLQNMDAFGFFDGVLGEGRARFETAGALGDGERIWALAIMPDEDFDIGPDKCQPYLLLSNSHTGKGSVVVKFTAVRVVCQNTLMLSMDDGERVWRVRHSKIMKVRLDETADLLRSSVTVYKKAKDVFARMRDRRVDAAKAAQYFKQVHGVRDQGSQKSELQDGFMKILHEAEDLQRDGVRGTLWAAYNAITALEDHRDGRDLTPERRLDRAWFGTGADIKYKALEVAREWLTG